MSSRIRTDLESLTRFRAPGVRPFRLLLAVVGLLCVGLLVTSPTARTYVPYEKFKYGSSKGGSGSGSDGGYTVVRPPHAKPVNVTISPPVDPETNRANATLLMLARNSDLSGVEASMRSLESAFNHKHNYPWTFLNEVPFSLEFKKRVRELASGEVKFGLIRSEDWYPPDWLDEEKYEHDRKEMEKLRTVPYAGSTTYRNMCRFNSGFFFRQNVLDEFKWYWRVEPHVTFPCEIPGDPFVYMIENNKRYSFTITIPEYGETIQSLWPTVKGFMSDYSHLMPDNNALAYLTDDNGESYNRCHFWSNFEVADLDFFRSPSYLQFFNSLDQTGNFFYERWGDAPVHSIGVALLLPKEQIHFFKDIGYYHVPFWNCPADEGNELQCNCERGQSFDVHGSACMKRFEGLFPDGVIG
ncbi:glycosyl transferase [Fomitiporia mediterranea MF3/22]|uniref:glycosyl transferase n=1 Tax=Fomitiporia mediterranea (strain MF3/22) TaxID=694068 RepID=UPI000440845F|nr:glycosyl transferase [Fomitiporia mediterranea MF3/22]EJD07257.1 glycosyl transferase [Fomitiporia mediterranea MF3/22]